MRRFFKKLRKNLRIACLAAALTTCWQVGQPASVRAATVPVEFSGTVSPAENDLSHLFLIYGSNYSGINCAAGAIKLGDFPAGQTIAFSVLELELHVLNHNATWWTGVGLYGDISGGQYVPGNNGVTIAFDGSEGDSWDTYFGEDEETIFNYLLNDDIENLPSFQQCFDNIWSGPYHDGWDFTDSKPLFDFSQASANGEIYIESEVVPEPLSIFLFGTGGAILIAFRRRDN